MKEEATEEYRPQTGRMSKGEGKMSANQAEVRDEGHVVSFDDPHLHTAMGTRITMPGGGVEHGGEVHYDTPTRSDSNTD